MSWEQKVKDDIGSYSFGLMKSLHLYKEECKKSKISTQLALEELKGQLEDIINPVALEIMWGTSKENLAIEKW